MSTKYALAYGSSLLLLAACADAFQVESADPSGTFALCDSTYFLSERLVLDGDRYRYGFTPPGDAPERVRRGDYSVRGDTLFLREDREPTPSLEAFAREMEEAGVDPEGVDSLLHDGPERYFVIRAGDRHVLLDPGAREAFLQRDYLYGARTLVEVGEGHPSAEWCDDIGSRIRSPG